MILSHLCGYKCLKHFNIDEVCKNMTDLYPDTVFYNRFVELEQKVAIPFHPVREEVLHWLLHGHQLRGQHGLAACSFFPKKPMIDLDRVSPCENGLIQRSLF